MQIGGKLIKSWKSFKSMHQNFNPCKFHATLHPKPFHPINRATMQHSMQQGADEGRPPMRGVRARCARGQAARGSDAGEASSEVRVHADAAREGVREYRTQEQQRAWMRGRDRAGVRKQRARMQQGVRMHAGARRPCGRASCAGMRAADARGSRGNAE